MLISFSTLLLNKQLGSQRNDHSIGNKCCEQFLAQSVNNLHTKSERSFSNELDVVKSLNPKVDLIDFLFVINVCYVFCHTSYCMVVLIFNHIFILAYSGG